MDMMGYGSHTLNFNHGPQNVMPTYYSDAFHHGNGTVSAQALNYRNTPVYMNPSQQNGNSKYYEFANQARSKLDQINSNNITLNMESKNKILAASNMAV